MPKYPGDVIDDIGRPLASGAKSLVSSIEGGIRGAGEQVQQALGKPAEAVGLENSPFRIIHDPLDAVVETVGNGARQFVEGIENVADGVTSGLDRVPGTFGAPEIDGMGLGGGKGFLRPRMR